MASNSTSKKPVESGPPLSSSPPSQPQPLLEPLPVKLELVAASCGQDADLFQQVLLQDATKSESERTKNRTFEAIADADRGNEEETEKNDDDNNYPTASATALGEVTIACSAAKTDKIRDIVEQNATDESKKKIYNLVDEIRQLSDLEKLLLYLKLPTGNNVEIDPLKQNCVSSLGSKFEVTQTVTWIETHLEENPEISMPKQEVYDGYTVFCQNVGMKALSAADFGKVMKQVFPRVRPRRLGTRGHSRYCYAGLCKKQRLAAPQLPDLSVAQCLPQEEARVDSGMADVEILNVASYLIREWAEKLLRVKFANLKELACYLVENSLVDNRSVAAFTALSCLPAKSQNRGNHLMMNQCSGSKHRETQMQLQRKLQEKELIKEQRKKMMEQRSIIGQSATGQLSQRRAAKRTHLCRSPRETSVTKQPAENGYHEQVAGQDDPRDKCTAVHHGSERMFAEPASECRTPRSSPVPCTSLLPGPSLVTTQEQTQSSGSSSSGKLVDPLSKGNGEHASTSSYDTVSAANRAGKVAIPRVNSGGQGSKRLLQPISQIIFLPSLSDCGASQSRLATKYKPIQPKPSNGDGKSPVFKGHHQSTVSESPSCDMDKVDGVNDCKPSAESCGNMARCAESSDASCSSSSLLEKQMVDGDCGHLEDNSMDVNKGGGGGYNTNKRLSSSTVDCTTKRLKVRVSRDKQYSVVCKTEVPTAPSTPLPATSGLDGFCHQDSSEEVSISSLENDALIECMHPNGGSAHVDPDDELAQCFMGHNVVVADGALVPKMTVTLDYTETHTAEISQLRQLLEKNLSRKSLVSQSSTEVMVMQENRPSNDVPVLRQLLNGTRDHASGSSGSNQQGYSTYICGEGHAAPVSAASSQFTNSNSNQFNPMTSVSRMVSFNVSSPRREDVDGASGAAFDPGDCGNVDFGSLTQSSEMEVDDDNVRFMDNQDFASATYNYNYGASGYVSEKLQCPDDQQQYAASGFDEEGEAAGTLDEFAVSELKPSLTTDSDSYFGDPVTGTPLPGTSSSTSVAPPPLPLHPSCTATSGGHSSVPPSPNTRRRAFNFMPISPQSTPGPEQFPSTPHSSASHSPLPVHQSNPTYPSYGMSVGGCGATSIGGINTGCLKMSSQPASAANSPFVSPRSTPSSHCRSRHNSGQASSASTFGTPRGTPHTSAANHHVTEPSFVAMCASSAVNSPFVSPHPTPVPVCRSRHNSSQNMSRLGVSAQFGITSGGGGNPQNQQSQVQQQQQQQQQMRSRHPSEMGFPQMSPASAPMSPMEYGVTQIDPDTFLAGHFSMPSVGDTPQMRSRHSSNSSVPPLSPRSAPMSPMVNLATTSMVDVGGTTNCDQQFMKPSLVDKPALQYRSAADQMDTEQGGSYVVPSGASGQGSGVSGSSGSGQTWGQQQQQRLMANWANAKMDPRLVSRQRHASHGSAAYSFPGPMLASNPQSWGDQTAQEVSSLLQKPPPLLVVMDAHRSQSVPLLQMLQNAGSLNKQEQFALQEKFSKSYPATPNMEQSFQFQADVTGETKVTADGMEESAEAASRYGGFQGPEALGDLVDALPSDQEPLQDMYSLQATIDDLRACDKDFSKFSQDLQ